MKPDLHHKGSHVSIPLSSKEMEWHFEPKDAKDAKTMKPGDKAHVMTPVVMTSQDEKGSRFRAAGDPRPQEIGPQSKSFFRK